MAVLNLEALVLRGVAVLCGGVALNLRRGTSVKSGVETPEVDISMRHPSPGGKPNVGQPVLWPDRVAPCGDDSTTGAGRSLRHAGVSRRHFPARSAGRAIPLGWAPTQGRTASAAAASQGRIPTRAVTSVAEVRSPRPQAAPVQLLPTGTHYPAGKLSRSAARPTALCKQGKPAGRTPPGWTTWEEGAR
jgi:hypothetical protein